MTILRAVSIVGVIIVIGIVASALYVVYDSSMHAEDKGAPSGPVTAALIERGKYLTRAADCAACHNAPNGKPFAGGLPFKLPFGTIYSTNITADRETGIGGWSDDDFVRALHRSIAPGGRYLYHCGRDEIRRETGYQATACPTTGCCQHLGCRQARVPR